MKAVSRDSIPAILLLSLAALGLWGGIYAVLQQTHRAIVDEAAATRASLARSLSEYEASSVRAIDLALKFLRDGWSGDAAAFDRKVQLYESLLRTEKVIQVAVVDAEGWLRYSRIRDAGSINFADREYFREQRARSGDELHVSELVMGRITGQWAIQFSRPLRDRNGDFAGVIVVAVPPPELERVYSDIALGSGGVVTLARRDGALLARSSDFETVAGKAAGEVPPLAPGAPRSGEMRMRGAVDGVERFVSYRALEDYPLVVYVGQSVEAVLAPYHRERAYVLGIGGAATALLAGLAFLLVSRARDKRKYEEDREKLMLELHDGCIQSIYAVGLNLHDCRSLLREDRARADTVIAQAEAELNLVIQDLRAFIAGEPRAPYDAEQFIAEIDRSIPSERGPAFSIDIDRSVVAALDSEQQAHVLRIVREAASNVVRHAQAARSRITLAREKDRIRLEIADDGRGVTGDAALGGVGVAHIHSRARKLRGSASVTSEASSGTRVLVQFPERP